MEEGDFTSLLTERERQREVSSCNFILPDRLDWLSYYIFLIFFFKKNQMKMGPSQWYGGSFTIPLASVSPFPLPFFSSLLSPNPKPKFYYAILLLDLPPKPLTSTSYSSYCCSCFCCSCSSRLECVAIYRYLSDLPPPSPVLLKKKSK